MIIVKIQSGEHVTDTQQTHDKTAALILQLPNPLLDPSHQALTVPCIPFQAEPQEGGGKKRPEDFSMELAVRACHVTCDRTGEGGPAQGCRVTCAGLLAPGGNGHSRARGTVGLGESDTVGGWVWAAPPGSRSSSGGWLEHTEEATQRGLEAGGQSKPGWGIPRRDRGPGRSPEDLQARVVAGGGPWGAVLGEPAPPPPPPGRSEGGGAGAPGGPHQAERRGSGGTDGDARSSGPSSAPHRCRTLRPSRGGIEPLLPPSEHTEGLPLTSHSVGLRFSLSEAPGTPLCPEHRGRSGG